MNIDKFISDASGIPESESAREKARVVANMLTTNGHPISPNGVRQWIHRNAMPAKSIVAVLKAAGKEERHLRLENYI